MMLTRFRKTDALSDAWDMRDVAYIHIRLVFAWNRAYRLEGFGISLPCPFIFARSLSLSSFLPSHSICYPLFNPSIRSHLQIVAAPETKGTLSYDCFKALITNITSCAARWPPQYAPAPWPWLWPFDLEVGVGVACDCAKSHAKSHVICAKFRLPRPFGFRVRADVRDIRQTDRRTDDGRRWPPNAPPTGRGHNNHWGGAIRPVIICSHY